MHRSPATLFKATATVLSSSIHIGNPYHVLGLEPGVPFSQVRSTYHKLTQVHHPDMNTGNAEKFVEITEAYRILRAQYRAGNFGKRSVFDTGTPASESPTGEEFWRQQNERVREEINRQAKEREQREREYRSHSHKPAAVASWLGYEVCVVLVIMTALFLAGVERYYSLYTTVAGRRSELKRVSDGTPAPMPMELDEELSKRYHNAVSKEELERVAEMQRKESLSRRRTQKRFSDFREFMYTYDLDGMAQRKVTTARYSVQYLKEKDVPKRCPIVRSFNSRTKPTAFNDVERELTETIAETPWAAPDAAYAGSLISKGLGCIPVNTPASTKWTFIEYKDTSKPKSEPLCLAAIRNEAFSELGMVQEVTVTGNPSLTPKLTERRAAQLKNGELRKRNIVYPGKLPLRDLSIPLENLPF